jgi:hypothetical protein
MAREHRTDGDRDSGDVRVAAEFSHEAAAGLERTEDGGDSRIRIAHPVQHGVREDRIELRIEGQRGGIHHARVNPSPTRSSHHLGRRIVAAADIEDPLTGPRRQARENVRAQRGHERRVLFVLLGIPGLSHHRDLRE